MPRTVRCFVGIWTKHGKRSYGRHLKRYRFTADISGPIKYQHLIGHTDQLEHMTMSDMEFFKLGINVMSLKQLEMYGPFCYGMSDITKWMSLDVFRHMPRLEAFTWILSKRVKNLAHSLLKYFSSQKSIANLKSISLMSSILCVNSPSKEMSLEICRMLLSLGIQHIELSPVELRQPDMDFLMFWYHGDFGHVSVAHQKRKRDCVKSDLKLSRYT